MRWIVGAYGIWTDRFISTGNVLDMGTGQVPEVHRTPLPQFTGVSCLPTCIQFSYLADSQDNFAYAVFADLSFDITPKLEGSVALRYDKDERENTTETPPGFLRRNSIAGKDFALLQGAQAPSLPRRLRSAGRCQEGEHPAPGPVPLPVPPLASSRGANQG